MEINICSYKEKAKKDIFKKIIEESFGQKAQSKSSYVKNKLKSLYINLIWNVIFIKQKNEDEFYLNTFGPIFFCKYNKWKILIYSRKKNYAKNEKKSNSKQEKEDDESDEDCDNEFEEKRKIKEEDEDKEKVSWNKENANLKHELKKAENMIKIYKSKIDELKLKLDEKVQKMKELKKDPFLESFYPREQMLALNFISNDQTLHYAISCVKKDLFVDIEKHLYDKFPKYKETNNSFLVQGKIILRFKTIEENELENGIPILLIQNQSK